jgi:3-oxoacyl-[acyl-carrier-protein] synthase II
MPTIDESHRKRRVVVTGIGIVSSAGIGKEAFWNSLRSGRSGIRTIKSFDMSAYPCAIGGEVSEFDPLVFMPAQLVRRIDRFAQLGLAAAKLAIADTNLNLDTVQRDRVGVAMGTSLGTLAFAEQQFTLYYEKGLNRINPFFATSIIPSTCVTQMMINLGIQGPCQTVTTACASSTTAVGLAAQSIRKNETDIMLAGGSEAPFSSFVLATLAFMQLLVTRYAEPDTAYRPFSKDAAGFALGEAAAVVVLEELGHALKRDANIYGEIAGCASSSDAHHVMDFSPDLSQASRAVRSALKVANLSPGEIEYINAHGTAIPSHDTSETAIVKKVFGERAYGIPISTTKPYTGHVLGASGGVGLVACALMMQRGYLHPTLNFTGSYPQCDLDYIPNDGYLRKVNSILLISFGFGGYNSACVLRSY